MRPNKSKWYCGYNPSQRAYELFLTIKNNNIEYFATDITLIERTAVSYMEPILTLEEDQAQQLMDALWAGGLRPTEGHGSAGQLGATERHLADMRKLAFQALGIKGEK